MNSTNPTTQDFNRDVRCLFGLPVDNLTMESTKALLHEKVGQKGNVVFSTINVNWVVQSFASPAFRAAILNSDIVTLDGKPLLWLAKLLGYPMSEVVPGSTLIQELHHDKNSENPLSLFLFGGEEGAARQAQERVNRDQGGLRAVGSLNPGFGTVEEMSSDGIITAINKTQPDILLVALGAQKGTKWIELNRNRLNAKIISHLGATVNFLAGTVQRAPKLFRKLGLEWVWRILQEPKLFTRYAYDGLVMLRMLTVRLFLWGQFLSLQKRFSHEDADATVHQQEHDKEIFLSFGRNVQMTKDFPIRAFFSRCVRSGKDITLDFRQTQFADGAFMGLLLILMKHQQRNGKKLALINAHGRLAKVLHLFCMDEELGGKRSKDMTVLVPFMLFGWIPLTVILFLSLKPHRAVLFSVIGGWLLLPTVGYDVPGLPEYSKSTAIALGLILGGRLSGQRQKASFQWKLYDIPMILWCLCPIATSLTNQLGFYDGLSNSFNQIVVWGIPYLAGRIYFNTPDTLRDLCLGIVIGGLLYVPLCLYEIRMSPRLSINFYGFFPHDWIQHKRYGGWRPIVFMQHGLMVALWMAISSTVAFWLWRSRDIERLKGIPMSFIVMSLVITAVLCKSANSWFALALGCGGYFIHRSFKTHFCLLLLLLVVPLYTGLRISGFISGQYIETVAVNIFDAERVSSLGIRLLQEDLFIHKAMERPLFGWGGYSRGWPVDPFTGDKLISWVDSLWLITFSTKGFFGLISFISALLIGPCLILRSTHKNIEGLDMSTLVPVVLSLAVVLFMIDSLVNGMINPAYIMISGALVGWYLTYKSYGVESSPSR